MPLAVALTLTLTPAPTPARRSLLAAPPRRGNFSPAVSAAAAAVSVGEDLPAGYDLRLPVNDPSRRRRAGILLHPTSLPGPHGAGDLGSSALAFLDWLHSAGCRVWQILPLVPPGRKSKEVGSPYSGQDANCGNTLLISLEDLVKDGLLTREELPDSMDMEHVEFDALANLKDPLIVKAAGRVLQSKGELKEQFLNFRKDPNIAGWLEDAAIFAAIDNKFNTHSWYEWPEPLKDRHPRALEDVCTNQKEFIDTFIAQQFLFQRQWQKLRLYAKDLGIKIMGDMPIYVGYHSSDVWVNRRSFLLDKDGFPVLLSGVPPDAFSKTGQLWGSPLYDWKAMEADDFMWWIQRLRRALDLFDEFRIDHFRGFAGFWAVPSESEVAMVGSWKAGPGNALFDAIFRDIGRIDLVAEDLGVITEDVVELRKAIGAPGMAVLQFAFGSDPSNPHLPHNHELDQVIYTGTHDNDTVLGWWQSIPEEEKQNVCEYLGRAELMDVPWSLIRLALSSVARTTIIPMQDILGLGSSARMNTPATQAGNWRWRIPRTVSFEGLTREAEELKRLIGLYNRL